MPRTLAHYDLRLADLSAPPAWPGCGSHPL